MIARLLIALCLLAAGAVPALAQGGADVAVGQPPTDWVRVLAAAAAIATPIMAFLGFTFGVWVNDWFHRRRERDKEARDLKALGEAFASEICTIDIEIRNAIKFAIYVAEQPEELLTPAAFRSVITKSRVIPTPVYTANLEHAGRLGLGAGVIVGFQRSLEALNTVYGEFDLVASYLERQSHIRGVTKNLLKLRRNAQFAIETLERACNLDVKHATTLWANPELPTWASDWED